MTDEPATMVPIAINRPIPSPSGSEVHDPMKILIIISNDLYVRNYLSTAAFSSLEAEYSDIFYLCESSVKHADWLKRKSNFVGTYTLSPGEYDQHIELLNVLMWRFRKKSSTFLYRFLILFWPKTSKFNHENPPRNLIALWLRYLKALKYPFLGNTVISKWSIPVLKSRIRVNPEIHEHMKRLRPDLVVLPSSAYDPIGTDLVTLSAAYGYQTLFLIDNWDNLSSKSILWKKPDFLSVWGEQTKQHAVQIHDMAPERVFPIGTPRFDRYDTTSLPPSPYPFPYAVFCGCSEPFDELSALHLMDQAMAEDPRIFNGMKLVYRPHPRRHKRFCDDLFRAEHFSNVILDRQIQAHYYRPEDEFHPDLDYYPALLLNAACVVASLTTMVIEALICGKPVLAIVYDDQVHFSSPHNTFKYFHHFKGLETVAGLRLCHKKESLGSILCDVVGGIDGLDARAIRNATRYFLHHDDAPYAERVRRIVDTIRRRSAA